MNGNEELVLITASMIYNVNSNAQVIVCVIAHIKDATGVQRTTSPSCKSTCCTTKGNNGHC